MDHRFFREAAAAADEGDGTAAVSAAADPTVMPAAGCSDGRAATRQQQYAAAKNACTVHWAMTVSRRRVRGAASQHQMAGGVGGRSPSACGVCARACVYVCGVSGVCVYVCILACARALVCVCVGEPTLRTI